MRLLLPLLALVLLSGCPGGTGSKPEARVVVGQMGAATTAEIDALRASAATAKAEAATQKDLAQRAAGAVYGASNANAHNQEGLPKEATDAQLVEAASALPGPTPAQMAAKEKENMRILAGELIAVKAEMGQRVSENQALRADLAASETRARELEKTLAEAEKAGAAERATAKAALQRQFDDLTAKINKARQDAEEAADSERKSMRNKLSYVLLGGAILGMLVAGATMYLTKGMEWERAAMAAGAGASCAALYWALNQSWFIYLAWATGASGVAAVVWYLWRESRQNEAIRAKIVRGQEADEAESTLTKLMGELDASQPTSTIAELRERLSKAMSDPHKALIHELRAEAKRASP